MYHVLIAVDADENRALAQAETIADLPGTDEVEATIFHVFGDNPSGASATQVAAVRRSVERLEEAGIETRVQESSGDPADTILDAAEEAGADLVCIGGRKRTPAGKALFGSVTQSVILNSDRPVVVTGGQKRIGGQSDR